MSNAETIKAKVVSYLQTHGNDCLLTDIALEAYGREVTEGELEYVYEIVLTAGYSCRRREDLWVEGEELTADDDYLCLLYTSPSPRDISGSRMPSSA